jgi:hypothetical protein
MAKVVYVDDAAIDLPHGYYEAIGEFMFRYAQLEHQMHQIIWRALKIGNKEGRVLTIGTDAKVLCAMINVITSENPWITWVQKKALVQEMNSIAGDARKMYPFRNVLAHGTWQHQPGKPQDVVIHFMKEADVRIMPRRTKVGADEIHQKCGKLRSLNVRAEKLIQNLHNELTTSQQKSA